jgi:hypothetical protein
MIPTKAALLLKPSRGPGKRDTAVLRSILITWLATASFPGSSPGQQTPTLDTIMSAWKTRQNAVRIAKFSWTEHVKLPKGSVLDAMSPKAANPNGLVLPPEDLSYDSSHILNFDENKLYYWYRGKVWSADSGRVAPQEYHSVFDGHDSKIYWPSGLNPIPNGVVRRESGSIDAQNMRTTAILKTYRPFQESMGINNIKGFVISPQPVLVNGKSCFFLRGRPFQTASQAISLWVDPTSEYSIVRYQSEVNDRLDFRIDINYTPTPDHGWVPSGWEIVWMKPRGSIRESVSAKVSEYVLNEEGKIGEIALDYPPNTYVIDEKNGSRYIMKEGSSKRYITEDERRAPYSRLLETETGMAFARSRPWFLSGWFTVLSVVVALAVSSYILIRLLRRKSRPIIRAE